MKPFARKAIAQVMKQFTGSGVSLDEAGRLCLPDDLDPERVHRFIELCTAQSFDHPRAAMHSLFARVGVAPEAIEILNEILGENAELDWNAIAHHPLRLGAALPQLLEIPRRFHAFLIDGLELADPTCATLDEAVVSTRETVAARLGCEPRWSSILEHADGVSALAAGWRSKTRV